MKFRSIFILLPILVFRPNTNSRNSTQTTNDFTAQNLHTLLCDIISNGENTDMKYSNPISHPRQTSIYPQLQRATQRPSWERIQRLPTTADSTNDPIIHVHRSHLPYALLPTGLWRQQPRLIYIRNSAANRIASDYYREYRLLHGFKGTPTEFTQLWRNGHLIYGALTEHELAFELLQARGLQHVHVITFDEDADENGWQSMVKQFAEILQVHLDGEQCAELVYWLRMELNAETAFRRDVLTMDTHFKRPQTQNIERTDRFDELE